MSNNISQKKLLLLDGHSLAFRAFYALPLLQTSKGLYTNAVYGFTTMLLRLLEEEKPDYILVAFDHKGPTFRHQLSEEYKAQRKEPPQEFAGQVDMIRQLLDAYSIAYKDIEGYEADDIIGTLALDAETNDLNCTIVTGDRDLLQLVTPLTKVYLTKKGISSLEKYAPEDVKEKYGFEPSKLTDYRGLKGDPSDNIPGVPGIGSKTASSLVKDYGALEDIIDNIEKIKSKKVKENLQTYHKQAILSKELSQICRQVSLGIDLTDCIPGSWDDNKLRLLFAQWEFTSLLETIKPEESVDEEKAVPLVDNNKMLANLVEKLRKTKEAAFLFDIDPPHFRRGLLQGITVALSPEESYYIKIDDHLSSSLVINSLSFYFQDRQKQKLVHDCKLFSNILNAYNLELSPPYFDTLLAAYILQPGWNSYEITVLVKEYLHKDIPAPLKKGTREEKDKQKAFYLVEGVKSLFPLYQHLHNQLEDKGLIDLYQTIELPLADVLGEMERHGIGLDENSLMDLNDEFSSKLETLEQAIYTQAGMEFNLNSPKQLSHVMFEKMGIKPLRKTKTGYSTDAKVLEELAIKHEIAQMIIDYRTLVKIKSTYIEGLLKAMNREKGCLYTTFNQAVTATGRLSSSEPNLQNIPIKWEEGRRIRLAFKPCNRDNRLLAADYSQIELRILAHLSQDSLLMDAFNKNEDIHTRTASEIFAVPPEKVDNSLRGKAKAVNFGIIYGISDYGLSRDLKISREEAKSYIENYFARYQGVQEYMDRCIEEARESGYVTTLLKRRRYLPELHDKNFQKRSFAERMARNTPIQGSAADIIKLAMLSLHQELKEKDDESALVLQVHDELILEAPTGSFCELAAITKKCMEEAITLSVPLIVDLKAGNNWYEMYPVEV